MDLYRHKLINAYGTGGENWKPKQRTPIRKESPRNGADPFRHVKPKPPPKPQQDEIRSSIDDILEGKVDGVEVFVDEFGLKRARIKR